MSWSVKPGFIPSTDAKSNTAFTVEMKQTDYTRKTSSNSAQSYYLNGSNITTPPVVRVEVKNLSNIYSATNVASSARVPITDGKEITLSIYDMATLQCDSESCKLAMLPVRASLTFTVPNWQFLDDEEAYNSYYTTLIEILLGTIPKATVEEDSTTYNMRNFAILARGVKDIVTSLPSE
jgi:hypothetical protein